MVLFLRGELFNVRGVPNILSQQESIWVHNSRSRVNHFFWGGPYASKICRNVRLDPAGQIGDRYVIELDEEKIMSLSR